MKTYEYGRIRALAQSMAESGIDPSTAARILEGGDLIRRGTKPEGKADWMRAAMRRMDALLDTETRRRVRERCACCLGGKRLEISKSIARESASLDERNS